MSLYYIIIRKLKRKTIEATNHLEIKQLFEEGMNYSLIGEEGLPLTMLFLN